MDGNFETPTRGTQDQVRTRQGGLDQSDQQACETRNWGQDRRVTRVELGGTTCLTLLVEYCLIGFVCFSSCQGASQFAKLFATIWKKTRVRQVVLDKWLPLMETTEKDWLYRRAGHRSRTTHIYIYIYIHTHNTRI